VVDYEATAKDAEVSLDAEWQDGYKRHVELYQWVLRQKAFEVCSTAWYDYVIGCKDRPGCDAKLKFRISLLPNEVPTEWISYKLQEIKTDLSNENVPKIDDNCEYYKYTVDLRILL